MFHKIYSANKNKILWIRKNNYIIFLLWNVYYYNILSGKNKYYAEEIYIHNRTTKRHHVDLLGNVTNQYDFMTTVNVCLKQVTHPNSTRLDEY